MEIRLYSQYAYGIFPTESSDRFFTDTDQTRVLLLLTALERNNNNWKPWSPLIKTHFLLGLCGFKQQRFSEVYQGLASRWIDVYTQKGSGLGATYGLAGIPMRIDFIFADSQMKILHFERFRSNFPTISPLWLVCRSPKSELFGSCSKYESVSGPRLKSRSKIPNWEESHFYFQTPECT